MTAMEEKKTFVKAENSERKITVYGIYMFLYVLLEAVLFCHIAFAEMTRTQSAVISYSAIVLCFLSSVFLLLKHRDKEHLFLLIAYAFTLAADFFLVILDWNYELAVTIFIGAQVFHFARMMMVERRNFRASLIIRIVGIAVAHLVFTALKMPDYILYAGSVYGINLLMNLVDGIAITAKKPLYWPLIPGFLLFACCDICVAAFGVGDMFGIPYDVQLLLNGFVWIFYLPSQVLLVLAGCGKRVFLKRKDRIEASDEAGT